MIGQHHAEVGQQLPQGYWHRERSELIQRGHRRSELRSRLPVKEVENIGGSVPRLYVMPEAGNARESDHALYVCGLSESAQATAGKLGARLQPFLAVPAYITKRGFPHYFNAVEGMPRSGLLVVAGRNVRL